MATLLITVLALASHVPSTLSIAETLVQRGHRVLVHSGQRDCAKVQVVGTELVSISEHCDIMSRLQNSSVRVPSWIPVLIRHLASSREKAYQSIDLRVLVKTIKRNICMRTVECSQKQNAQIFQHQ